MHAATHWSIYQSQQVAVKLVGRGHTWHHMAMLYAPVLRIHVADVMQSSNAASWLHLANESLSNARPDAFLKLSQKRYVQKVLLQSS